MVSPFPHEVVDLLLSWYRANARDLPWRASRNPYAILVSEIMLQQTRAETVKPYFHRFMSVLPTIADLADADEPTLLKLWEGLGYYSRVRNLQRAAKVIMEQHGGIIPADFNALLELPGVGRYTAGAVASIAFDIPVPAVDGNVLRVWARLTGNSADVLLDTTKRTAEADIAPHVPLNDAGDFTQSLIELGALVCLPGERPLCNTCPLSLLCAAHREGRQNDLPVRIPKTKRRVEHLTVLVLQHTDPDGTRRFAIRRRPPEGLLGGMYEFPYFAEVLLSEKVTERLAAMGLACNTPEGLPHKKHIFSHVTWEMDSFFLPVKILDTTLLPSDWIWVTCNEMETSYPIPSAHSFYRHICKEKDGL